MYDVKLVVSNAVGADSLTLPSYIDVLSLPASPVSSSEAVCEGDLVPDLIATGDMIKWYDDSLLTNMIHAGDTLATGQTSPGVYTYYVTQTVGLCESPATVVTLTINAIPVVGLSPFDDVCVSEPAFTLTGGTPEGGVYSGPGVTSDTIFDPSAVGAGTYDITYTFTDPVGCSDFMTEQITVHDLPTVTFEPLSDICINSDPIELTGGMPEGGEYSGVGVTDGIFDPMEADEGTHPITYTYVDMNGCSNSAEQMLTVNGLPQVEIGADTAICAHETVTLDATTAGAASYLWMPGGQTSAQITVDSTGVGVGSGSYTVYVTDGNGCVGEDSKEIEFFDCTGIGEMSGVNNIKLYPNPGQGDFSVQIESRIPVNVTLKVYNNRGVTVFEEEGLRIVNSQIVKMDLSSQPAGIYLVTVYNNEGRWVEKLIIRK
jgi:hypothetical protein